MTRQTLLALGGGASYCCLIMTTGELGFLVIEVTILEKKKKMEEIENKMEIREIRGTCDKNKCPPTLMVLNSFLSHFKYNRAPMKLNFSHMTFNK